MPLSSILEVLLIILQQLFKVVWLYNSIQLDFVEKGPLE